MQLPKYTNTNLIIQYLIKIELSQDRIRRTVIPKSYLDELIKEIHVAEIHNLSMLLNDTIGIDEAERVYLGKVLPSARSKHLIYSNYRSAIEFSRNYDATNFVKPSADLILHLNKLVSNRVSDEWESGRFRGFSEKPISAFDTWYKLRDYYTTINFEQYFDELLQVLVVSRNRVPETIKYGIILYEFIDKSPLLITNQVTALALISSLASNSSRDRCATFPIIKSLKFISEDIVEAYKLSKSRRDLTPFIEAFLYSTSIQYKEHEDLFTTTLEQKVKKHGNLKNKLNNRQIRIMDHLEHTNSISREEYAKMMGVSFMTAFRDIQGLVKKGFLESEGIGRGTHYVPTRGTVTKSKEERLEVYSDLE